MCGLKQLANDVDFASQMSHPSWVCGLKPFVYTPIGNIKKSHPSWVCGLKHSAIEKLQPGEVVTPFVGVWIETHHVAGEISRDLVTPFVGVWIETDR